MKPWNNGTIGKLKPVMKKLLIALLVLIAAYAIGAAVFAVANGQAEGKVVLAEKQLILDGDMEKSGTSDWTAVSGAVLSKQAGAAVDGARVLRVAYNSAVNPVAQQTPLTVGKKYRITGWARSDGTAGPAISTGTYTWIWLPGTTSTSWQKIDETWIASNNNVRLIALLGGAGYAEFDDIVITEYSGKTTISGSQLLTDGDMEEADTSSWSSASGGVLTKESGAVTDGSLVLRIEAILGDTSGQASQNILTSGKRYRIKGWVRGDGVNGYLRIRGADGAVLWTSTTSNGWQPFDFIHLATGATIYFETLGDVATSDYTELDDVLITEYAGKTTTGGKQLLADGDMEAADTSAWTNVAGGTLTKESGAAVDGGLVLRLTDPSSFMFARQDVLTAGKRYRVKGWVKSPDASSGIYLNGTQVASGGTSGDWEYFDGIGVADGVSLSLRKNTGGTYVEFDDVVVFEL